MEKPLVLKRRFRLEKLEIVILILWFAYLLWRFTQDAFAATTYLLTFMLISAHRFLRRITLSPDNIAIWDDRIFNRVIRFERITSYFLKPSPLESAVDVEVTVQQLHAPTYAIFSNRPASPARQQEKTIRFVIEREQTEALLGYLQAQGAVIDKVAETEWRKTQILLTAGNEISRLEKQGEESSGELLEVLRKMEDDLAKVRTES